jgi:hypothetical protein
LARRFDDPGPGGQSVGIHKDLIPGSIYRIDREGDAVLFGREACCDRCARRNGGDRQDGGERS